eukprot:3934038-Rhodomonas_salina.1
MAGGCGQVRCWGDNELSALGIGWHAESALIGDVTSEMGSGLSAVALGTAVLASDVSTGWQFSTCVVTGEQAVKVTVSSLCARSAVCVADIACGVSAGAPTTQTSPTGC